MIKVAAAVAVFFCVVAFSDFSVSIRPENDVIVNDLTTNSPASQITTPSFAVPGDVSSQPGSAPRTVVDFQSEIRGSGSEIPETVSSSSEKEDSKEFTAPLTFINFRQINRHFPKRPLAEIRFHRRPCRFHHSRFRNRQPWGPRLEIPYGQDMILSGSEEETGSDSALGGVPRQIPATWVRIQEENEEKEREMLGKITMKIRSRGHRYHDEEEEEEEEDREKDDEKDEGEDHKEYKEWFMKKVRKFLKHQF